MYTYRYTTSGKYIPLVFLYKYTAMHQLPVTVTLHSRIDDCIIHIAA